uniref:Uncharacterized protein n=1 Tax=Arundo donax TaxID=35708 RepID=A0A0A9QPT5_ARUDO
MPIVSCRW